MNKDEIQPSLLTLNNTICCGLVMNKDEIQPRDVKRENGKSCGLVMNKDEIQQIYINITWHIVVVW